MAATPVPVTQITRAGVTDPAVTDANTVDGNSVSNGGNVFVEANNTDASTRVVTVVVPGAIDGQPVTGKTVSLNAGQLKRFGPFPVDIYGNSVLLQAPSALVKYRAFSL